MFIQPPYGTVLYPRGPTVYGAMQNIQTLFVQPPYGSALYLKVPLYYYGAMQTIHTITHTRTKGLANPWECSEACEGTGVWKSWR